MVCHALTVTMLVIRSPPLPPGVMRVTTGHPVTVTVSGSHHAVTETDTKTGVCVWGGGVVCGEHNVCRIV